jgi:hypothetical protein
VGRVDRDAEGADSTADLVDRRAERSKAGEEITTGKRLLRFHLGFMMSEN